jgi:hypothetical protein
MHELIPLSLKLNEHAVFGPTHLFPSHFVKGLTTQASQFKVSLLNLGVALLQT